MEDEFCTKCGRSVFAHNDDVCPPPPKNIEVPCLRCGDLFRTMDRGTAGYIGKCSNCIKDTAPTKDR